MHSFCYCCSCAYYYDDYDYADYYDNYCHFCYITNIMIVSIKVTTALTTPRSNDDSPRLSGSPCQGAQLRHCSQSPGCCPRQPHRSPDACDLYLCIYIYTEEEAARPAFWQHTIFSGFVCLEWLCVGFCVSCSLVLCACVHVFVSNYNIPEACKRMSVCMYVVPFKTADKRGNTGPTFWALQERIG